jgi:hypothetical protein
MNQTTQDIDIFKLTMLADRPATIYHDLDKNDTFIYIGAERFTIPHGSMALSRPGDHPLKEKFRGFGFAQDVKLDGWIKVFQMDELYLVMFATEKFTEQPGEPDAVNDIILLKAGNALDDVKALS